MTHSHIAFSRSITVQPDTSQLYEVRRFVESVAADATLDSERTFDLMVAVSEACANAVEHSGSPGLPVKVKAACRGGRLVIQICDYGGFRLPSTANGFQRDHRGLGLPLMVALMDEVRIAKLSGGGTKVTLSVKLPAPGLC